MRDSRTHRGPEHRQLLQQGAARHGSALSERAPPIASFGAWLKRNRELRELGLEEVVAETRLPARIVVALEENDTSVMADRSYALQYVRATALAVGLDPEDAALRYEEWLQGLPPATLPPPAAVPATRLGRALAPLRRLARVPQRISKDPMVWAVVLGTLVAAVLLLWKR